MGTILEVDLKSFAYDEDNILENINLKIEKGEIILLTGNSGCGKSTLLRLMNGLIPEFYEGKLIGEIKLKGKLLSKYKKGELAKYIGNVFQNPKDQFFCTIVEDEIALVGENMGMPRHELIKRVDEVLDLLEIEHLRYKSIFDLSGGERQKVAIACTLVYDTDLIFFDEPSSSLDYKSIENLKEIFCILKNLGKTIVVADHRIYYLKSLYDRLILMERGEIKSIYKNGELRPEMCSGLGLRVLDEGFLKAEKNPIYTKNVIEFNNIKVMQNKEKIMNEVSFSLREGEVMGIIGKNGTGKTTLARTITGLTGKKQNTNLGLNEKERLKNSYYVQQDVDSQIFLDTVENELLITSKNQDKNLIKRLLKTFGLWEERISHPQKLSGGQKQRLAVITALLSGRELIILDEPTAGLDYRNMEVMANLLNEFSKRFPIIIITHDTELLFKCCHYVLLLDKNTNNKIKVKGNECKIFEFIKA
ncbi:ABC transporter ATP-binding protein [Peptoniphilus sp. SGI.035]|uniref:ABC transporter ATP-binding protein n=1 Tax=Peptoniphilus sp. SGI.035 TaxID=3420564 RepID=UPI003CFDBB7A